MKLVEKIQEEVELADFYVDRNASMNIMRIFRDWLQQNCDCDSVQSLEGEIRRAGGFV